MLITATEFKNNFGKYLLLAAKEDIFITKNGKTIAKLTSPYQNKSPYLPLKVHLHSHKSPPEESVDPSHPLSALPNYAPPAK